MNFLMGRYIEGIPGLGTAAGACILPAQLKPSQATDRDDKAGLTAIQFNLVPQARYQRLKRLIGYADILSIDVFGPLVFCAHPILVLVQVAQHLELQFGQVLDTPSTNLHNSRGGADACADWRGRRLLMNKVSE